MEENEKQPVPNVDLEIQKSVVDELTSEVNELFTRFLEIKTAVERSKMSQDLKDGIIKSIVTAFIAETVQYGLNHIGVGEMMIGDDLEEVVCPSCQSLIAVEDDVCPSCGAVFEDSPEGDLEEPISEAEEIDFDNLAPVKLNEK